MRLKQSKKPALENENVDNNQPPVDTTTAVAATDEPQLTAAEDAISQAAEETEREADESQQSSAAMESIFCIAAESQQLITSGACSLETAELTQSGIQRQLRSIGWEPTNVSLEEHTDPVKAHQIATEGFLRDFFNNMAQNWVVARKKRSDEIIALISGVNALANRYAGKAEEAVKEFKAESPKWTEKTHIGANIQTWNFFSMIDNEDFNLVGELKADLEMSEYVLKEYPKKVMEHYKKALGVISSATIKNAADLGKLAAALEKLGAPQAYFDRTLLRADSFFNCMHFEIEQGRKREPVTLDGKNYAKFAELASPETVVENTTFSHKLKQVGDVLIGGNLGGGQGFQYTTEDCGFVNEAAVTYVENVRSYMALSKLFAEELNAYGKAMARIQSSNADFGEESSAAKALLVQINQYFENIENCFRSPATKELSRSLKGSRFSNYLGLRLIFNAK